MTVYLIVLDISACWNIGQNHAGLSEPGWGVCEFVEWCFNTVIRQSEEHLDFLRWQQLYRASPHKIPSYLFATIIKCLFSVRLCVCMWRRQKEWTLRVFVCMRAQKDQHEEWVDPSWGQKNTVRATKDSELFIRKISPSSHTEVKHFSFCSYSLLKPGQLWSNLGQ